MASEAERFGTGWRKWGAQAWVDHWVVKLMMTQVGDVIPKTYLPILRLVSHEPEEVDAGYERIKSKREPVRWFDSPRDKWRKTYGAYVRELDWVYGELARWFPQEQYQELVIDILARTLREGMGRFLPRAERAVRVDRPAPSQSAQVGTRMVGRLVERILLFLSRNLSPVNAIVGPVETRQIPGGMEMYIPHCWMHAAPCDGRTQDRACVEGCKGSFEALFNDRTPVAMHFEPHLPEYSCTLTVKMAGRAQA